MNIQSISELSLLSSHTTHPVASLTAKLDTVTHARSTFTPIATAICSTASLSNILSSVDFNVLSCKDFYIEASYNTGIDSAGNPIYKSLKFNLGDALSRLAKSISLVAIRNLNALTQETADELYVPYAGNIGSSRAVSGLWLTTLNTGHATALSVDGPITICNSRGNSTLVEIIPADTLSNSRFEIKDGIFDVSSTLSSRFSILSAAKISATQELSTELLYANALYAGQYASGGNKYWNISQGNQTTCQIRNMIVAATGRFTNLSTTNLTAINLSAISKLNAIQNPIEEDEDPSYNLTAGLDSHNNATIGTTNLTATSFNCTGNIDCGGHLAAGSAITCVGGFTCISADGEGNEGNVHCDGGITCGGTLGAGAINCGGKFTGSGDIELTGGNNKITCTGGLTCQSNLSAAGTIKCSDGLTAGGDLALTGENHSITCTGGLTCQSNLSAAGTIKCSDGLTAGGDFALTGANHSISCTGDLSSSGKATVGKSISCVEDISCAGNLRVKGNLSASIYTDNGNTKAKIISDIQTAAATLIVNLSTNDLTCKNKLCAGIDNDNCNLYVPNTGAIEVGELKVTDLTAGCGDGFEVLKAKSDDNKLTLNALTVTSTNGLSAAGISELTAKAACWS